MLGNRPGRGTLSQAIIYPRLACPDASLGSTVLPTLPLLGKEDGRSCKKVTIRMTIRKNDCRSNTPVRDKTGLSVGWKGLGGSHSPGSVADMRVPR